MGVARQGGARGARSPRARRAAASSALPRHPGRRRRGGPAPARLPSAAPPVARRPLARPPAPGVRFDDGPPRLSPWRSPEDGEAVGAAPGTPRSAGGVAGAAHHAGHSHRTGSGLAGGAGPGPTGAYTPRETRLARPCSASWPRASARAWTGLGDATAYPLRWSAACRSGRASVPRRWRSARQAARRGRPERNMAPGAIGGRAGWSCAGGRRARQPGSSGHRRSRRCVSWRTRSWRARARSSASPSRAARRARRSSRSMCRRRRRASGMSAAWRIRACHSAGEWGCIGPPGFGSGSGGGGRGEVGAPTRAPAPAPSPALEAETPDAGRRPGCDAPSSSRRAVTGSGAAPPTPPDAGPLRTRAKALKEARPDRRQHPARPPPPSHHDHSPSALRSNRRRIDRRAGAEGEGRWPGRVAAVAPGAGPRVLTVGLGRVVVRRPMAGAVVASGRPRPALALVVAGGVRGGGRVAGAPRPRRPRGR